MRSTSILPRLVLVLKARRDAHSEDLLASCQGATVMIYKHRLLTTYIHEALGHCVIKRAFTFPSSCEPRADSSQDRPDLERRIEAA